MMARRHRKFSFVSIRPRLTGIDGVAHCILSRSANETQFLWRVRACDGYEVEREAWAQGSDMARQWDSGFPNWGDCPQCEAYIQSGNGRFPGGWTEGE